MGLSLPVGLCIANPVTHERLRARHGTELEFTLQFLLMTELIQECCQFRTG